MDIRLLIVAGEASGDAHAAALVRALRDAAPDSQFEFYGSTGAQMRTAGVESIVKADELAIMGLWEVGRALPKFWHAFTELKRAAEQRRPDAAILVDWPDFNLRLARWLRRRGIPVLYYISPQLWAWRSYRTRNIQRDVDLILSILPFEKEWYATRGINNVRYVGHPLAGKVCPEYDRAEFCRLNDLNPKRPIVALLPGSRHKELVRILPPMIEAVEVMQQKRSDIQFVIMIAPNRDPDEARKIIETSNVRQHTKNSLTVVHGQTREALAAADAAAVASGTATLEAGLLGTPLVIVYKESALNWHTLGNMITTDHYGLVNLISGRTIATELIQDRFTADSLAAELTALLDAGKNASMRAELNNMAQKLGDPGASGRAANAILDFLAGRI